MFWANRNTCLSSTEQRRGPEPLLVSVPTAGTIETPPQPRFVAQGSWEGRPGGHVICVPRQSPAACSSALEHKGMGCAEKAGHTTTQHTGSQRENGWSPPPIPINSIIGPVT